MARTAPQHPRWRGRYLSTPAARMPPITSGGYIGWSWPTGHCREFCPRSRTRRDTQPREVHSTAHGPPGVQFTRGVSVAAWQGAVVALGFVGPVIL